ncbi:MAG: nucleotidyltransferase domain-containing protein [Chloroflexota bacterium]|nr:nucleotidyltransferase domain-containing protein [Chloroflexota bacterium]
MMDRHLLELAEHVAGRLGSIEGVAAVALGGSMARREAHPDSDIDLGVYYRLENPPSVVELRSLAEEIDDRHPKDAATNLGEWGPWINGGAWLQIRGQRVDWLYRDLDRVEEVFAECRAGRPSCHYQPGHPHGFHNHTYIGEAHYCCPLYDPDGELAALKEQTAQYPRPLKLVLIEKYLWEAHFALKTSHKSAGRGDIFYVSGCAFRCVACLVQVLFALNERYFVNEKGSVKAVSGFPSIPSDFEEIVEDVLGGIADGTSRLKGSVERLGMLVDEVRTLCTEELP